VEIPKQSFMGLHIRWGTMLMQMSAQADRLSPSERSLLNCCHKDIWVEFRHVL